MEIESLAPCVFLALGIFLIAMNWMAFIDSIRNGSHHSLVIALGAGLAALGLYLSPSPVSRLWWLPFFLDIGCIPGLALVMWRSVLRARSFGRQPPQDQEPHR